MIRSFVVASVTIIVVVLFGAGDYIAAQQPPSRASSAVPIQFTGAMPGASLELFMNAGKVANVTIDSSGQGASVLDLSNLGKVQMQVYVDVCQDGKVVKVLVVSGQPPPEDDNCKRRIAGAAWKSDCGATRFTLNITTLRIKIDGCGNILSENKWIYPVAAGGLVTPFLFGGGGATTATTSLPTVVAPPPIANTPVIQAPVLNTTTPAPDTQPAPSVPVDFAVAVVSKYFHPDAPTSIFCLGIQATAIGNAPALNSTATYTGTITGPGVVSGGTFSGNLDASGRAVASAIINSFGNYVGSVTVLFGGTSRSGSAQMNVGPNQGSGCP